ncbi:cleavage and polyadenylation specificity factor subunit 1-like, partial [Melozone crissalis]|uniref:cleavage and polyadenylation specificity factor subunit 1-like n=1 Tax=Melozone crissalis TaxID=40204 RepID=UPI0023D99464
MAELPLPAGLRARAFPAKLCSASAPAAPAAFPRAEPRARGRAGARGPLSFFAPLLGSEDADLSVVEYDPGTHDLKTLSLHYFEEPELRDGFVQNVPTPRVRVDPGGRCAVMLIYGTRLVVLPFRRDSLADEHEGLVGEGQKSIFLPSHIIDVRELDEKLLNIIDVQFLHGCYEPTLLTLCEPNQTWPGCPHMRVAVRQDTCSIVAISLNILQRVQPVICSLSSLPFDCTQALPGPKP